MTGFEWFVGIALVVIWLTVILTREKDEDIKPTVVNFNDSYKYHEEQAFRDVVRRELHETNYWLRRSHHSHCDVVDIKRQQEKFAEILQTSAVLDPDMLDKWLGKPTVEDKIEQAKKDIDYNAHDLGEFGKVIRTGYAKNIIDKNFSKK